MDVCKFLPNRDFFFLLPQAPKEIIHCNKLSLLIVLTSGLFNTLLPITVCLPSNRLTCILNSGPPSTPLKKKNKGSKVIDKKQEETP